MGIIFQMQFAVISLFGGRHRIRVLPGGYLINLCKFENNEKFVGFCATGNFATNRLLLLLYGGLRESSSSSFLPRRECFLPDRVAYVPCNETESAIREQGQTLFSNLTVSVSFRATISGSFLGGRN